MTDKSPTIYDIMWRKDIYPSKKEIVKDIRHHELYVLEKDNKIIGAMVLNHEYDECYNKLSCKYLRMMMKS